MVDLADIKQECDEHDLKEAIRIGDKPVIAEYLRKFTTSLPVEIAHELADYLEDRWLITSGPKKRKYISKKSNKKLESSLARLIIVTDYEECCRNKEYARWLVNQHKEEFHLVAGTNIFDEDGNFSPRWQYPDRERKRNQTLLPRDEDIKEYLCNERQYGISERYFDDILSAHNAQYVKIYKRFVQKGHPPDEVRQWICKLYRIEPGKFSRMLNRK